MSLRKCVKIVGDSHMDSYLLIEQKSFIMDVIMLTRGPPKTMGCIFRREIEM